MAQSLALLDWSAFAWTLRRPQSVAAAPEYSCSFCWRESEDLDNEDVEPPDATGPADLVQLDRQQRARIAKVATLFMTSDCKSKMRKVHCSLQTACITLSATGSRLSNRVLSP